LLDANHDLEITLVGIGLPRDQWRGSAFASWPPWLAFDSAMPKLDLFFSGVWAYRTATGLHCGQNVPDPATPLVHTPPGMPTTERVALAGIFVTSAVGNLGAKRART
jgi:hypothetical protein